MKILSTTTLLAALALLASTAPTSAAQDGGRERGPLGGAGRAGAEGVEIAHADAALVAKQLPSYPLQTCVHCDARLDSKGGPLDVAVRERLVRLCSVDCYQQYRKRAGFALRKIDAAIRQQQAPSYPLKTCVVTGTLLADADRPVDHVHGTRLVRLASKEAVQAFRQSPTTYMETLDQALMDAQRPSYPTDQCIVSTEPLSAMGEPVEILHGIRLVRFCCKGCVKQFEKDPATFLAQLDQAAREARKGG